jgi:predicted transposase/invertase (TIGR01784 family)
VVEVQFQPDEDLYYRLFAELFLYLRQYQPPHPWQVVVIYPHRGVERVTENQFQELLNLNRVTRIYLQELEETENTPLSISLVKLIIAQEKEAPQKAKVLLKRTKEEPLLLSVQNDIIDLIESIMVYKFPQKSRQEIATMLGVDDLKQTRFYQEVFAEGKQEGIQEGKREAISRMLDLGLELETIAQCLDLPLEVVREEAQKHQNSPS